MKRISILIFLTIGVIYYKEFSKPSGKSFLNPVAMIFWSNASGSAGVISVQDKGIRRLS
ncbi:MAG: hypothetical protein ACYDA4_15340 [Ignavibacteriaceae bacterium]